MSVSIETAHDGYTTILAITKTGNEKEQSIYTETLSVENEGVNTRITFLKALAMIGSMSETILGRGRENANIIENLLNRKYSIQITILDGTQEELKQAVSLGKERTGAITPTRHPQIEKNLSQKQVPQHQKPKKKAKNKPLSTISKAVKVSALPPLEFLELPATIKRFGLKKTSIYTAMKEGTFPSNVSLSSGTKGWIATEVDAVLKARASGKNKAEIKKLVADLILRRK